MYALERGLGMKWLGVFAAFTMIASFGIGNMVQANSISTLAASNFGISTQVTGLVLAAITAIVVLGGLQWIARVCEFFWCPSYDLIWQGAFAGDIDFYRKQAQLAGGRVLELGAGTGRITIPMARDGIEVYTLDVDTAMLDRLRTKLGAEPPEVRERVTIVLGDMRRFAIDTRFAQVFAPFRAFLHNVTVDDRRACLARVREHLAPRGRFVFNIFHPSLTFMARHAGALEGVWRWGGTVARPDGGFVVRSDANRYDTVRQIVHSHHRYEEYAPDGVLARTTLQRLELAYVYPADLLHLLQDAGFHDVDIAGGFDGRPFARDTDELVVVARAD